VYLLLNISADKLGLKQGFSGSEREYLLK